MSTIESCTCANAFQDAVYGRGQRVHNQTTKGRRCTVCSTEKVGGGIAATEGKKKGTK